MFKYFNRQKNKTKTGFAPTPTLVSLLSVFKKYYLSVLFYKINLPFYNHRVKQQNTTPKLVSGFAVLFAVLLASFLITLGISIFSISLKEIQIATSARDSQVAYYIADSAAECALYWDVSPRATVFPPICNKNFGGQNLCLPQNEPRVPVRCNGNLVTLDFKPQGNSIFSTTMVNFFQASSTSSSTPVADINITINYDSGSNAVTRTQIVGIGHNTGIIGRRVERAVTRQ